MMDPKRDRAGSEPRSESSSLHIRQAPHNTAKVRVFVCVLLYFREVCAFQLIAQTVL